MTNKTDKPGHGVLPVEPQPAKCPLCDSPKPYLHPAMQADGGEIEICKHPWHGAVETVPVVPPEQAVCAKCGKPKFGPTTIASGAVQNIQQWYCCCGETYNGVVPQGAEPRWTRAEFAEKLPEIFALWETSKVALGISNDWLRFAEEVRHAAASPAEGAQGGDNATMLAGSSGRSTIRSVSGMDVASSASSVGASSMSAEQELAMEWIRHRIKTDEDVAAMLDTPSTVTEVAKLLTAYAAELKAKIAELEGNYQSTAELQRQLNDWVEKYGKRGVELCADGWQLAHDPASCGHPRACWLDRNYPESQKNYNPGTRSGEPPFDYRCIMCEAERERDQAREALRHCLENRFEGDKIRLIVERALAVPPSEDAPPEMSKNKMPNTAWAEEEKNGNA